MKRKIIREKYERYRHSFNGFAFFECKKRKEKEKKKLKFKVEREDSHLASDHGGKMLLFSTTLQYEVKWNDGWKMRVKYVPFYEIYFKSVFT